MPAVSGKPQHPNVGQMGVLSWTQCLVLLQLGLACVRVFLQLPDTIEQWASRSFTNCQGTGAGCCRCFWSALRLCYSCTPGCGSCTFGVDNLNVVRHVRRVFDDIDVVRPFVLMNEGDLLSLVQEMVKKKREGTTRKSIVVLIAPFKVARLTLQVAWPKLLPSQKGKGKGGGEETRVLVEGFCGGVHIGFSK